MTHVRADSATERVWSVTHDERHACAPPRRRKTPAVVAGGVRVTRGGGRRAERSSAHRPPRERNVLFVSRLSFFFHLHLSTHCRVYFFSCMNVFSFSFLTEYTFIAPTPLSLAILLGANRDAVPRRRFIRDPLVRIWTLEWKW